MTCLNNILPSSIDVVFRKLVCGLGFLDGDYVISVQLADLDCSSNLEGFSGFDGTKTFHETMPAVMGGSSSSSSASASAHPPTNLVDLQTLAKKVACDFYSYQSVSHDVVYNGIVAWSPEGISDSLEFAYDGEDISTRIIGRPINGEPDELAHADWTCHVSSSSSYPMVKISDVKCEAGTLNVYGVTLGYANGETTLNSVSAPFFLHSAGCCDCPAPGCQQYCAYCYDFDGNPVSGRTAVFNGYTGTSTPWSTSGTTDETGKFCYTLPTSGTIPVIQSVTMYSPDSTCYATSGFTASGSICNAYFSFCATIIVITTVDGSSGDPLSGVTLVGPFYLEESVPGQTCNPDNNTNEVIDGAVHTFTTYTIYVQGTTSGCSQTAINYATGCLSGWWGGCISPGVLGTCGETTDYTIYMWDRSAWNLNVQGLCINGRAEVYPKSLCFTATAGPAQVFGGNLGTGITLTWDSTSWDGDPSATGSHVMRYIGCVSANGAYGMCAGTDVDYGNAYVLLTIQDSNTGPLLRVTYQPLWETCNPSTDVAPKCDDNAFTAGPAYFCPVPGEAGSYFYQMPYTITWGSSGWEGSSTVDGQFYNAPISLTGPTVPGVSGWVNECAVNDPTNPDASIANAACTVSESCGDGVEMMAFAPNVALPPPTEKKPSNVRNRPRPPRRPCNCGGKRRR